MFAVTFSVVFAYVADVTDESERSSAYGLVSATFAASLVTSPALGAYLEQMYSEEVSKQKYLLCCSEIFPTDNHG